MPLAVMVEVCRCGARSSKLMKIVCPHCGEVCETAEDVVIGQHIICPYCKTKFSYGDLPGRPSVLPVEKNEPDDVPTANPPKATKNKVVFDFNRCERELSAKWHRKVKPAKFKWTKGKIAFWSIVVLFNLIFLVFGLPTCLDEWQTRKAEERAMQGKLLEEHEYSKLREWYNKQLRYNGLAEVTMGTGWDKAGGFQLSLTDGSMDTIILDYSPRMGGLSYPRNRIQPGFAIELVRARIKIAEYEAKYKH